MESLFYLLIKFLRQYESIFCGMNFHHFPTFLTKLMIEVHFYFLIIILCILHIIKHCLKHIFQPLFLKQNFRFKKYCFSMSDDLKKFFIVKSFLIMKKKVSFSSVFSFKSVHSNYFCN